MGTNFYVRTGRKIKKICDCGFEHEIDEELHIGKNSFGWMFVLHVIPEKGINELCDWIPILFNGEIHNEYGDEIPYSMMIKIILKDETGDLLSKGKNEIQNFLNEMNRVNFQGDHMIVMDERSGLLRARGNSIGKEGNYCLFCGEFS